MREQERIATFTFDVPLRFSFDARADVEPEVLLKMADAYIDLVLKAGQYDIREKGLNLVSVKKHYSKEELEEKKKADKEFNSLINRAVNLRGC